MNGTAKRLGSPRKNWGLADKKGRILSCPPRAALKVARGRTRRAHPKGAKSAGSTTEGSRHRRAPAPLRKSEKGYPRSRPPCAAHPWCSPLPLTFAAHLCRSGTTGNHHAAPEAIDDREADAHGTQLAEHSAEPQHLGRDAAAGDGDTGKPAQGELREQSGGALLRRGGVEHEASWALYRGP